MFGDSAGVGQALPAIGSLQDARVLAESQRRKPIRPQGGDVGHDIRILVGQYVPPEARKTPKEPHHRSVERIRKFFSEF